MVQKIYFTLIVFLFAISVNAQIKLYATTTAVSAGQTFKVSVKVDNFTAVSGFQMYVNWDAEKLEFLNVTDLATLNLNADNDFKLNSPDAPVNSLACTWAHPASDASTLAQGSILFSIEFKALCGSTSLVDFIDGNSLKVRFFDTKGDAIAHTEQGVNVVVTGSPCGTAQDAIGISNINAPANSKVCIPVNASLGFQNITSIITQIQIPQDCGNFNEISNINSILPNFSNTNFDLGEISSGIIKLNWSNGTGISVADGTKLFDICYTPSEACCNQTKNLAFNNVSIISNGAPPADLAKDGTIFITCQSNTCDIGQEFTVVGSKVCGKKDDIVTVDFQAYNFENIVAMYYSFSWDHSCLELQPNGIIIPTPNLLSGFGTSVFSNPNDCGIFFNWFEPSANPLNLADGSIFVSLRFKLLKDPSPDCLVNIGAECLPKSSNEVLILDGDNNNLTMVTCPGVITLGITPVINDISQTNPKCAGSCDGAIQVAVSGASSGNLVWVGPGGFSATGAQLSNLCAGVYTLNASACNLISQKTYTLNEPAPIVVTLLSNAPSTLGNNGALDINVVGGTGTYTYAWSPSNATTQDISGLAPGSYTISVTDQNGCSDVKTFTVASINIPLAGTISAKKYNLYEVSCFDACDGELTVNVSGGVSPYTFKWSTNETTSSIDELCAGLYILTITDAQNNTRTLNYTVIAPPKMLFIFEKISPSDDQSLDGSLKLEVEGGFSPYTFAWSSGGSATNELNNIGVGTYTVSVTDQLGCSLAGDVELTLNSKNCYVGSSVITPNGDGKNDNLEISCITNSDNKFVLFNRWGAKVFEATNISNLNNTFIGNDSSGDPLPDDAYYWVLEIIDGNKSDFYKGNVTILRSLK